MLAVSLLVLNRGWRFLIGHAIRFLAVIWGGWLRRGASLAVIGSAAFCQQPPPPFVYQVVQPVQSPILAAGGNFKYQEGYTTLNVSAGAASGSYVISKHFDIEHQLLGSGYEDPSDTGIVVYVLGPPGTPFQYSVTKTESASAASTEGCIADAGNNDAGVGAYPGQSFSKSYSNTTPPASLVSGSPTITYNGNTYSSAFGASLGTTTVAYVYYGPGGATYFTCQGTYNGSLSFSAQLIRPGQQPPTAVIAPPIPPNPIPGTAVTLDGSGSYDTDGDSIIQYQWTIQNSTGATATLYGPTVQYTWNQAGTYGVTLTVTDSDGQTGIASTTIAVENNSCTMPTGETTTATPGNWDTVNPAVFHFYMVLQGGDFSGGNVNVRETDAGNDVDTCYFNGSQIPYGFVVNTEWTVGTGNIWGFDGVGWKRAATNLPDPVAYYRSAGRAPCHFLVWQQMQIQCPDGTWQNYGLLNPLTGTIGPNNVTSCRAGVCQSKRY